MDLAPIPLGEVSEPGLKTPGWRGFPLPPIRPGDQPKVRNGARSCNNTSKLGMYQMQCLTP